MKSNLLLLLSFLITSFIFSQSITNVSPNSGDYGDALTIEISASGVDFTQGSPFTQSSDLIRFTQFGQGSGFSFYGYNTEVISSTKVSTDVYLPSYNCGLFDVDIFSFNLYAPNAFTINCGTEIFGTIFNDENGDGVQDNNEEGIPYIMVSAENYSYGYTNSNGDFALIAPQNQNVTVSIDLSSNSYYCDIVSATYTQTLPSNPEGYSISTSNLDIIGDIDFGLQQNNQDIVDVGIYSLIVNSGNEAGEMFHAWMNFISSPNISSTCILRIEHDPLLSLISSSSQPSDVGNDYVEWQYAPGEAPAFDGMEMIWKLSNDAVDGNTLHWEAFYNCENATDACPEDNHLVRDVEIISGPLRIRDSEAVELYSVRPEGNMPYKILPDAALSYVIMFSNSSTFPANNVTIRNTLPDGIDITSISSPFSSHEYSFRIIEPNILEWEFEDINLLPKATNELGSYGFIQFNALLESGVSHGAIIPNQAIALFNAKSESSNVVEHEVDKFLSYNNDLFSDFQINLYPNPAMGSFFINSDRVSTNDNFNVSISNVIGEIVYEKDQDISNLKISTKNWIPGIYMVKIGKTNSNISSVRKIVIH